MRISTLIVLLLVMTPVVVDRWPHAAKVGEVSVEPISANASEGADTADVRERTAKVVAAAFVKTSLVKTKDIRPIGEEVVIASGPLVPLPPIEESKEEATAEESVAKAEPKRARSPFKLMSAQREAVFRKCFPRVNDPDLEKVLNDPDLVIYSEAEMPKAYQFFDGAFPGVHAVNYNISANGSEPYGNGNREFPWSTPAGTHRSSNVYSFRFFLLPKDPNGRLRPVVWNSTRQSGAAYSWTFPVGTVFGEVLMMHGPNKRDYTFELRVRRREIGQWEVDAYRPFPTADSLAERIKELRPNWESDTNLAQICAHLDGPRSLTPFVLVDTQPRVRTFKQSMGVETLPAIEDQQLVSELLSKTTFQSASGQVWRESANGVKTCAPTTQAAFHIVPANYDAGFVAVDQKSCMRCHSTVNESVRKFDPGRDWYGNIRGSDGIFSFHPFAPESISHNGFAQPVRLRQDFEKAGILEKFDPARHVSSIYQALSKD